MHCGANEQSNDQVVCEMLMHVALLTPYTYLLLLQADGEARVAALALFQEQLLGRRQGPELRETLEQHMTKARSSHTICCRLAAVWAGVFCLL